MKDLQELMSLWQQVEIQEKKKLDPVGQEDGDIDNDGDTDSSDEYLKNRRKAVGKSMGKSQKEEDCDCDLTDEKEPKKKVSKKEGYGTKKESSAAYGASQQKIADKKKKDAMSSSDKDKLGKLAALMKKEGKMACPKCKGEGCDHCEGKGYHMKEEAPKKKSDPHGHKAAAGKPLDLSKGGTKVKTYDVKETVDEAMGDANHKKAVKHITDLGKKNKMTVGQQRMHIDNYPNKYDKTTLAHAKTINSNQYKVESVESLEDMVLPTDRTFAKWTEFSEKYDELNSKGKKRPQDRPIGKSDEKPPSPGANQPKDMGGEGNSEFEKHTYGATPPEGIMDKESPKSKQFYKDHQKSDPKWENLEDEGHDDVSKAGRGVKSQSPNRMGRDNRSGDTKIINPITQKV